MIQVSQLSKKYNNVTVLNIDNLDIPTGQSFGLVGNNGAGKTSTLSAVSGVVRPSAGTIHALGDDITKHNPWDIVERGVVHVPEGRRIFPRMT